MFRKFTADEMATFLAAVDEFLTTRQKIVVLGGGALALAYDDAYRTHDIDLWTPPSREVVQACKRARQSTGLPISIEPARVSDAPYEAEERLARVLPDLKRRFWSSAISSRWTTSPLVVRRTATETSST